MSISAVPASQRTVLPPAPAMWTPSIGTRCGVAQYADALVAGLHRIGCPVEHAAVPGGGAGVLHLQHEHSLVAPEQVADGARRSRDAGVPFVVTAHTVRGQFDDWEGDVAALVAHSADGVTLLQERWPALRHELTAAARQHCHDHSWNRVAQRHVEMYRTLMMIGQPGQTR